MKNLNFFVIFKSKDLKIYIDTTDGTLGDTSYIRLNIKNDFT
jgi:hypothetical protein